MNEIRIVTMRKKQYDKIIELSTDSNKELLYKNYSCNKLNTLIDIFSEEDIFYKYIYFALIGSKLWELPNDWKRITT